MDKIPEENEEFSIEVDGYEFKIKSVENRMIKSVLVTKLPEKQERKILWDKPEKRKQKTDRNKRRKKNVRTFKICKY